MIDTPKYQSLLRILDNLLIEIRGLEENRIQDAKLIANILHKFPEYLKDWDDRRFPETISDLRKRILHHPETRYLVQYLEVNNDNEL